MPLMGEKFSLEEEHVRSLARRRSIERLRENLRRSNRHNLDFDAREAVETLYDIVTSLSDAEDRVLQLHQQCCSMLEQGMKILELDAMRRPVVLQIDRDSTELGTFKEADPDAVTKMVVEDLKKGTKP